MATNKIKWWKTPPESPDLKSVENLWHELKEFRLSLKPRMNWFLELKSFGVQCLAKNAGSISGTYIKWSREWLKLVEMLLDINCLTFLLFNVFNSTFM